MTDDVRKLSAIAASIVALAAINILAALVLITPSQEPDDNSLTRYQPMWEALPEFPSGVTNMGRLVIRNNIIYNAFDDPSIDWENENVCLQGNRRVVCKRHD